MLTTPDVIGWVQSFHFNNSYVLTADRAVLSNVISNVPAVLALKPFVLGLSDRNRIWLVMPMRATLPAISRRRVRWLILIVTERARSAGIHVSLWTYCRAGIPITLATLAQAMARYSALSGWRRNWLDMPLSQDVQHIYSGRSPPSDLPNRHRGCAASHQKKVRRHIVELDPHRDALCQADSTEGRIDESQQLAAAVLILNAVTRSRLGFEPCKRQADINATRRYVGTQRLPLSFCGG